MSHNDIDLDPEEVTRAAHRLADLGAELLAARRTAGANLESLAAVRPWGGDELGDYFAQRYDEVAARALDVWRTTAERLSELGSQVREAVGAVAETDRATSEAIDKAL
jgi:hypothetical protein